MHSFMNELNIDDFKDEMRSNFAIQTVKANLVIIIVAAEHLWSVVSRFLCQSLSCHEQYL